MRILIDLQGAQTASRFRGIGRYSLSLALAMARNAGKHEIWLALNGAFPESVLSIRHAFEGLIPLERIRIFEIPLPVAEVDPSNAWRIRAAEKIREHFLQQINPDVIHVSSLFEGFKDNAVTSIESLPLRSYSAITLYDLIPLLNQRDYLNNAKQRQYYLRKIQSLKNAGLLLAISEASRQEAIDVLQLPPNKVVNISAAADERFHPITLTTERILELQNRYGFERNIVMYAPGGFDQRKNFEGFISAYAMLSPALRANHQLVIVGDIDPERRSHLNNLASQAGLAKDEMVITGYITDTELVEFYNLASLFVFPSKHEGFGLPALEAMACGTPVIGSKNSSIPEVIGLPDALFDPFSHLDLAEKMTLALCDAEYRKKLTSHGLLQARKFTWDVSAIHTIKALESFVQAKNSAFTLINESDGMPELIRSIADINDAGQPAEADIVLTSDCIAFNSYHAGTKQLLLDISVIVHGDAKSGIQRVVRSLLRELIINPPPGYAVYPIYFDGSRYKYATSFIATFFGYTLGKEPDEIVDFCQDDILFALDLNAHLTAAVHNLHKQLHCRGIQLYFIVYDILLVQHPEWWPEGTSAIFEAWLHSISEVSTGLICISEAVAEEVRTWIRQNPPHRLSAPAIMSFHLGADVENSQPSKGMPENAQTVLAALFANPSFLMVGTVEPRKGHAQTLAAFDLLWTQGVNANLVIVGKRGWLVDHLVDKLIKHPELNRRLFWLEGISDEYLDEIYTASTCLIAPSEGEGFGLPLIEAAQHKIPILARDLPVFREVAGKHAYYFCGFSSEALANAITRWISLHNLNAHPKPEGMHFLTWQQSAMQLQKLLIANQGNFVKGLLE